MNKKIGVIIILCVLFSCTNKIPEMKIDTSEGFVDILLSINQIQTKDDGSLLITVENQYQNEKVGFQIEILNQWKISEIKNTSQNFYWGNGNFITNGEKTEKFVEVLSKLYSVEMKGFKDNEIPVEIVGLATDPRLILSQPTKMKFFFSSDNGKIYSEIFINTDIKNKILAFNEKDEEYREPLIKILCGER